MADQGGCSDEATTLAKQTKRNPTRAAAFHGGRKLKKGQNPTINHQCAATNKTVSNTTTRGGLPLTWASAHVVKEEETQN